MGEQKYIVRLSVQERAQLESIVKKGSGGAFRIRHAQILLHSDASVGSQSAAAIAKMLHCRESTVYEVRKRLVEQGFSAALERKKRETPATPRLFDGEAEARLIALACSTPPKGRTRSFIATAGRARGQGRRQEEVGRQEGPGEEGCRED